MSGIRAWLKGLGLIEYAEAFEAEKIDLEAAIYLNDALLEKISSGARSRLPNGNELHSLQLGIKVAIDLGG